MRTTREGLDLIIRFEGLRLKAYKDMVGVLTIGYGLTEERYTSLKEITETQAVSLLFSYIEDFEKKVNNLLNIEINDNQFSALVVFAYNLGLGALRRSTLLKDVNAKRFDKAADEFLKWTNAGGKHVEGLVTRRKAERELFLK